MTKLFLILPALATATVAAQESAAVFDAPIVAFDHWSGVRKLADVDGDGRVEALGWWWTTNYSTAVYASVHRQNPDHTWTLLRRQTLPLAAGTLRDPVLDVGRFDADGRMDWVISLKQELRVFRSYIDGSPLPHWTTTEPDVIERLLALDFSGDGLTDLAVLLPTELRLWRNEGATFTLTGQLPLPPLTRPVELEPGDVDGDGTPDLLLTDASALRLVAIRADAPVAVASFAHGLSNVRPAAGDIDGDGDRDVVIWGMSPDRYVVVRRTGPTAFAMEPSRVGGPARYLLDVDGDGDLDGVCCGGGGPYPTPNKTASAFRIAHNDGAGNFPVSIEIPSVGSERLAAAYDLDGDGDLDLVGGRSIYYARGPIRRDPHVRMPGWNVESWFHDAEGDGDLDFGLRNGYPGQRNAANGTFAPATPLVAAAPPGTTFENGGYPGDFDGDGDVDLIVRHLQGTQLLSMRLLRNQGGAFFDGGVAGPPGVDFHPMREWQSDQSTNMPVDLDGDGDLDLLTFTRSGATPHFTLVWRNDAGVFAQVGRIDGEVPLQVADLDRDGVPDLVMAGAANPPSYGSLRWRRGLGGLTYALMVFPAVVNVQSYTDCVAVADFDGDDDLDVIGGAVGQTTETGLLLNDGAGVFTQGTGLPPTDTLYTLRRTYLRDIDGDGRADLVLSTPRDSLGCAVLRGKAGGGFEAPLHQVVTPLALLDLDGDGDLDAATTLGVVPNVTFSGPGAGAMRQYGTGTAGTGGVVPTLGVRGPMCANVLTDTRLVGAIGGTIAVFVIGVQPLDLPDVPLPGMRLLVAPTGIAVGLPVSGTAGQPGVGEVHLPLMIPPAAAGLTVYEQFFVLDPGVAVGAAASNGLALTFGLPR